MSTRAALAAGTMLTCLTGGASGIALVDPPLRGTVVEDLTQLYVFDGMGGTPRDPAPGEEPFVIPNAFRGTVQMKVIHDTDGTYDFYFRITTGIGDTGVRAPIEDFFYNSPPLGATFTVVHHGYSLADNYTDGDIRPLVGDVFRPPETFPPWFHWSTESDLFGAPILEEAVFLLDTDAKAYAKTGQFWIGASTRDFSMDSERFAAFAPAIPEPTTYALMVGGAAVLVLLARRRRANA